MHNSVRIMCMALGSAKPAASLSLSVSYEMCNYNSVMHLAHRTCNHRSTLNPGKAMDGPPDADDPKISSGKGKAKGKAPTKSADAGAAKGGKKGAPGGKGKGAPSLSKSPVAPSKAMKPLWWKRLLFGTDLQPGAIWERVRDETQSLPAEELEHRFAKAQAQAPSKPTGPSPTGASEVIRIRTDAVQDREPLGRPLGSFLFKIFTVSSIPFPCFFPPPWGYIRGSCSRRGFSKASL